MPTCLRCPAVDASSIDLVVVPALHVGGVRRLAPGRAAPAGGDEPVTGGKSGDDEQRCPPQRVAGRKEDDPDHYSDQRDQPTEHGELARRTNRHGRHRTSRWTTARRDNVSRGEAHPVGRPTRFISHRLRRGVRMGVRDAKWLAYCRPTRSRSVHFMTWRRRTGRPRRGTRIAGGRAVGWPPRRDADGVRVVAAAANRLAGVHRRLEAPGRPPLVFPFHGGATIGPVLVPRILVKDVGLSVAEALEVIRG